MNKTEFLSNISHRLGRKLGEPQSPRQVMGVPDFWINRKLVLDAKITRFVENFATLGGEIELFDSPSLLLDGLNDFLTELSPRQVGAWGNEAEWPIDVETVLNRWDALRWNETTPHDFASVQVSITSCTYAIADTGTLVMKSNPFQGRSAHILPLVHVVVMTKGQLRLRLGEVFTELNQSEPLPASVHFVSGPSRSSDIENDQSIGVHGPARVVVFMVK